MNLSWCGLLLYIVNWRAQVSSYRKDSQSGIFGCVGTNSLLLVESVKECRFWARLAERMEMEFTAYVRGEGRITLPKEVRDALCIEEGCLVKCRVEKVRLQNDAGK